MYSKTPRTPHPGAKHFTNNCENKQPASAVVRIFPKKKKKDERWKGRRDSKKRSLGVTFSFSTVAVAWRLLRSIIFVSFFRQWLRSRVNKLRCTERKLVIFNGNWDFKIVKKRIIGIKGFKKNSCRLNKYLKNNIFQIFFYRISPQDFLSVLK